jgi:hypothetical protein
MFMADVTKKTAKAFIESIATYNVSTYEKLESLFSTQSLAKAFESFPLMMQTLKRLGSWISWDPVATREVVVTIRQILAGHGIEKPGVVGGVLEMVLSLLEEGGYRREVAEIILGLGKSVMEVYSRDQYPVRRLR